MSRAVLTIIGLLAAAGAWAYPGNGCMNRVGDALPASAHYVDPARAFYLQEELDRHRMIRLQPGGDYRKSPGLILKTGHEVYGLAHTRLPKVTIAGGATGVILSGVAPQGLRFQPSDSPIHHNCFERIWTGDFTEPFTIVDTIAADNLFLDIAPGSLLIDTRRRGHVRNNRFIRLEMHAVSPALTVMGSRERPSYGNVFLWTNVLTPTGDGIIVDGQEDIAFIGIDAEAWNWNRLARFPAMMNVANTRTVRVFMPHGGDNKNHDGRFFNVDAQDFQVFNMRLGEAGDPPVLLGENTRRVLRVLSPSLRMRDRGIRELRLELFPDIVRPAMLSESTQLSALDLTASQKNAVRELFAAPPAADRMPWEPAILTVPGLPPGLVSSMARAAQKDSSADIQRKVDRNGLVQLPAGVYYLSRPIRLRRDQGIVGAGASRTALVAMNRDIDLIAGADGLRVATSIRFILADISLIGGRNGILHDAGGSGSGAQYNHSVLSHVTFRGMTHAGIFIDGIYGWDNNLLDNVNFIDCDVGIKQRVPDGYRSAAVRRDVAGMTYLDKNVCYRCQFIGGRKGVEWPAMRPNNLNAFVNSSFANASERAFESLNTDAMIFANVDFNNNGGNPQVSDTLSTGFVSCRFRAGRRGVTMLDHLAMCEGCEFSMAGSTNARIARDSADVFLFNSRAPDMPLGNVRGGVVANSSMQGAPYNQTMVMIANGRPAVMVQGAPRPVAQLLVGPEFQ